MSPTVADFKAIDFRDYKIKEFTWKKMKCSNYTLVPSLVGKRSIFSYLAENIKNAALNFPWKKDFQWSLVNWKYILQGNVNQSSCFVSNFSKAL